MDTLALNRSSKKNDNGIAGGQIVAFVVVIGVFELAIISETFFSAAKQYVSFLSYIVLRSCITSVVSP